MTLEKLIKRVLVQHINKCKVHKALSKAFKPFILIDPGVKTKELAEEIKQAKFLNQIDEEENNE